MTKVCSICNRNFHVPLSKANNKIYCSKECKKKAQYVDVKCKECGKSYSVAQSRYYQKGLRYHYCSEICYNKHRHEEAIKIKESYIHHCINCGKKYKGHRKQTPSGFYFCSQECSKAYQIGEKHHSWKGGTIFTNGYRAIKVNGKYKYVHRIEAERKLKRPLEKNEVVHHKDGNKLNNSTSNLQIMNKREHDKIHLAQIRERRKWKKIS